MKHNDSMLMYGGLFLIGVLIYKYVMLPASAAPSTPTASLPKSTVNTDMGGENFGVADTSTWDD